MDGILYLVIIPAQDHPILVQSMDVKVIQLLQGVDISRLKVFPMFCFLHSGFAFAPGGIQMVCSLLLPPQVIWITTPV